MQIHETNLSNMEEVRLIILNTNEIDIDELLKQSSLSFDDESITNEVVLREKKTSFYLKNKYIGEYQISSSGKPISNNTHFNISHSHGVVVLAINDNHPVGVDIELIRDMEDNFKRYVCDDKEYELSKDNNEEFFKIWTNKESLLKCLGTGIKMKMNSVSSLPLEGKRVFENKEYYSHHTMYGKYIISITISDAEFDIKNM